MPQMRKAFRLLVHEGLGATPGLFFCLKKRGPRRSTSLFVQRFSRRLLLVPDGDALLVGKLFGMEHGVGDAGLLLVLVVLEGDEGVAYLS